MLSDVSKRRGGRRRSLSGIWIALLWCAAVGPASAADAEARFAAIRPAFVTLWNGNACAQGESVKEYVDHWIHDFYVTGSPIMQSWFAFSDDVIGRLPPGSAAQFKPRLANLGEKIAAEWAKPNDCRHISTWGPQSSLYSYYGTLSAATGSANIDPSALDAALTKIEASVNAAISR